MTPFRSLWLIPVFLALHNLEEFFIVKNALPGPLPASPEWVQQLIPVITDGQFAAALIVVTLVPCAALILGVASSRRRASVLVLLQIQVLIFLNVFVHMTGALFSGGYIPGLVSAVLLNFPFSLLIFRRARKERWIGPRAAAGMVAIGLVLLGPGMIGLLKLMVHLSDRF